MSKLHSYPWYTADWRGSEARMTMTLEQRGIYRELLDHHYEQGSLPKDERALKMIAMADDKEWKRSWPVVSKQFYEQDGRLYQRKVVEKLPEIQQLGELRKQKASKAAAARWDRMGNATGNAPSSASEDAPSMLDSCLTSSITITSSSSITNVGVDSPGPDTDPDPPRRTPPPSKPRIETRPAPAGMSRPGPLEFPRQREHTEAEKAIGRTLLAFTAGKLGEPLADPKLIEAISGELSRSGLNLDDLTEILKSKRAAVSAAKGWGLIVEIIRAACRGRPLKPRTNEFGRVLYPGDEGYAEAAN